MNKKIKILFLAPGKKMSLLEKFIEAGDKLGISIELFSYELSSETATSQISTILIGKKWTDPELLADIIRYINLEHVDIIVPCVDPAIGIAARLKKNHPSLFIPVSSEEICEITYDKIKADNWFRQIGVMVPPQSDELPLIAKPRKGSAAQGIYFLNDQIDRNYFILKEKPDEYLVQKLINGDEFTVDAYVDQQGNIVSVIPRKRIEVIGGEAVKSITVNDTEIVQLSIRILQAGKFYGPITLQFIRSTDSKELFLIEINPRLGGGVLNSIEAGAHIPLFIIQEFLQYKPEPVRHWRENIVMTRAYREVFICR